MLQEECPVATDYHAEHVGSLLRPPWLLEARSADKQGRLGAGRLRELEDRAALEAIELQRQAGIEVFTDGEVRRDTWMAGLLESTGGVVPTELVPVPWHLSSRRTTCGTASMRRRGMCPPRTSLSARNAVLPQRPGATS